jgi:hypothetical protein
MIKFNPNTQESRKKLNTLARETMKERLLQDIMKDLMVCDLENWDKKEYIQEIKGLINSIDK